MKIVSCGDSFTFGVGCDDPHYENYARLVSDKFGSEYFNLSKPAASNYVIYLQAIYAATLNPDLVIINTTSSDRVEWITGEPNRPLSANQMNFKSFADIHYFSDSDNYNPVINSDQVHAMLSPNRHSDPKNKLELIVEYNSTIIDSSIKLDYDVGIISLAYEHLRSLGIDCLILSGLMHRQLSELYLLNVMHIEFFQLARDYPDTNGTWHCSPQAHAMVANQIIEHLKPNYSLLT